MLLTEYNEAEVMELFKEDGRREGLQEGRREGLLDGRREGRQEGLDVGIKGTVNVLRSRGISDVEILNEVCKEYNLDKNAAKKYL